ncbi:hypothetical protein BU23DRAFT_526175 [Bimuria novae-zelandiae CBS 107.79]|uniref:ER-bound oxygenase mpaB/mpaB'/Rubber oxygenase catalytic domain-containing protein n=1 Tax=Bimuria novae-zelandiae CBS 107.79 TaxID=1447943 RepID=A0A6A5VLG1_9PLEO|nr:hypothetical protein BU23DRAFT_526175 [Bimuria novae-zelandiae CBS 107.79]
MAFYNPFRRRTENTRYCWGYEFEWTEQHITEAQSKALKHSYDVLGEECLIRLNEISPPTSGTLPRREDPPPPTVIGTDHEKNEKIPLPQRDLYILLRDNHESDSKLHELWEEVSHVPQWVDWEQIKRGQDVFYRYGGPALTGLTYQSLLGGMGAARVVETLARTGGFSTKVARRRLFETTQHILQCTKSLDSIQPGGAGWASSIRVRLLHAAVRQRIMKLAAQRPSYFNLEEWGVPVNDLDTMGTIGTFSTTLIWLSFPRQGIFLREQEKKDYVALWRYIGYIMGTPHEPFETADKAKALMESLLWNEVHPSEMSKVLSNNIIQCLQGQPPTYVSPDMLIASARWLNGNELADELGLPRVSWYYSSLMAGQCLFFMGWSYFYRAFPGLDKGHVERLKPLFYNAIVNAGWGLAGVETTFDFKYVPEYDTVTEMGTPSEITLQGSTIERRNLRALGIFLGVVGIGGYVSMRVASKLVGMIW